MCSYQSTMDFFLACIRFFLTFLASAAWQVLTSAKKALKVLQHVRKTRQRKGCIPEVRGVAYGQTVLVTTGRQAKTLHTVRALKAIGATVIVTDYEPISASAVSLACDKFIQLLPLDSGCIDEWVEHFYTILVDNCVDLVLPVSTINEVLFIGVAKKRLQQRLPHVQWLCPDLETAVLLDDRLQFSNVCSKHGVPVPESGKLDSRSGIEAIANSFTDGIVLKRVESSVNRAEEIIFVRRGESVPAAINPAPRDPWQWQRFVKGEECSVWYVCIEGNVTFCACYRSEPDLTQFDPIQVQPKLDISLRQLIRDLSLTGQFTFDFIIDEKTNFPYVIECNPRASSILETVSKTSFWGEAFFGVNVMKRTVKNSVGFLYHRNCWPWTYRSEGYFDYADPLPFFAAEVVWPMKAVASKGLSPSFYHHIDVNIGKIVVPGPSQGRNLTRFREELQAEEIRVAEEALRHMDTLLLDASIPEAKRFMLELPAHGLNVIPFEHADSPAKTAVEGSVQLPTGKIPQDFLEEHASGETRLLMGSNLSQATNSCSNLSYRVVQASRTFSPSNAIPLRKLRVAHILGSCTSLYYEEVSKMYALQCIENIGTNGRFEHITAYVHVTGEWSISTPGEVHYITGESKKISPGAAIAKLESMKVDVIVPHMFDYAGLTAFRGLFEVLNIPMVGCSAEALALSTNKAHTKACASMVGVKVPSSELLSRGDRPTMQYPLVVKPNEEDNSQGVAVVRNSKELQTALSSAFEFGEEVLCEEFIPLGRELRTAVVENSRGDIEMLPIIEYFLSPESPIRTPEDKIVTDKSGTVTGLATGGRTCPADVDNDLKEKLYTASVRAHKALGCRDYSIFDFRVSPNGEPYLLESCLYCSFSPGSVIISMQRAMGIGSTQLFERLVEQAMTRKRVMSNNIQKLRMKARS